MQLAFIGGGVMAEAMIGGVLQKGLYPSQSIIASDIAPVRRDALTNKYRIETVAENCRACREAEMVVLAIKPQHLMAVMGDLHGQLSGDQLVLSVVAGARLSTLRQGLKHESIVRVMPNMPARIGQGISAWTATPEVNPSQREAARSILSALGEEVFLPSEDYIDMATAVSGSGPAYFFLVMEALEQAAIDAGLDPKQARLLTLETAFGAAKMALEGGEEPALLRKHVTSPGGTTERAIETMEQSGIRAMFKQAVAAAAKRARELGDLFGKNP